MKHDKFPDVAFGEAQHQKKKAWPHRPFEQPNRTCRLALFCLNTKVTIALGQDKDHETECNHAPPPIFCSSIFAGQRKHSSWPRIIKAICLFCAPNSLGIHKRQSFECPKKACARKNETRGIPSVFCWLSSASTCFFSSGINANIFPVVIWIHFKTRGK